LPRPTPTRTPGSEFDLGFSRNFDFLGFGFVALAQPFLSHRIYVCRVRAILKRLKLRISADRFGSIATGKAATIHPHDLRAT
jgi:hypothetical protein